LDKDDPAGLLTVSGALDQVNISTSSALDTLKSYTPEAGSALDGPGTISFATGFLSKALTGHADDVTKAATTGLQTALHAEGADILEPGKKLSTKGTFGNSVESYSKAGQFADKLKQTGEIVDAAGKFFDVAKEAVKLNDAIKAAENEQATNSAATDVAEGSTLQYLFSLRKAGRLTEQEYLSQVRSYIAATNQTQTAGVTALVVDEWIAGAKFTQNSLVSLASSGVTKGKYAGKKLISGASTVAAKGVAAIGTYIGSLWSGINPNAK
jgi:hypothetical protein